MATLNACRNDYASGGTQGGSLRNRSTNYATCPTCGKRIQITKSGRLRTHGTLSLKRRDS